MYFEGCEVTPYQDPIEDKNLKEGAAYYIVGTDNDSPLINTVFFIGKNLEPGDSQQNVELCYFQDSLSYFAGVRYGSVDQESDIPTTFLQQPANNLNGIYNLEAALQILMYCLLKLKNN